MTAATVAVREHPILFSGPMVSAINAGKKTQTRRPVRLRAGDVELRADHGPKRNVTDVVEWWQGVNALGNYTGHYRCPYGQRGDRLWVRETWAAEFLWPEPGGGRMRQWADMPPANRVPGEDAFVAYRADGAIHGCTDDGVDDGACADGAEQGARWEWKPSIHMPRWASRLTLELNATVRVERVQEISAEDCRAEGVEVFVGDVVVPPGTSRRDDAIYRDAYAKLWNKLNASRGYGWDVNPLVWVLAFKRVDA